MINLDPAVADLSFGAHIDIRDTVNYKEVMKQYGLGPNGGILTSLNLFATKFDEVVTLAEQRANRTNLEYIFVDTPGQIEIFTWSASGAIITELLASTFPTVICYVVDTPRTTSPTTFMSNMLYACSILYKSKLPLVVAFNKTDIANHDFAVEWMKDFEAFELALHPENNYMATLTRSMCLAFEEFYRQLNYVGVSSITGSGMTELMSAFQSASREYEQHYRMELEKRIAEKKKKETEQKERNMIRLRKDLEESEGHTIVLKKKPSKDQKEDEEMADINAKADSSDNEDESGEEEEYNSLMKFLKQQ